MPRRVDLLGEVLRLVAALTDKPVPRQQRFDWEWPEEEDRERDARAARQDEEDRAFAEERRLRREAGDRQLREAMAPQRHERSAIGQASDAAWRANLGTPEAHVAYDD